MLIGQALMDRLAIIGTDQQFDAYGVQRVW